MNVNQHILVHDGERPQRGPVQALSFIDSGQQPASHEKQRRIGIWDLGAWLGNLSELIEGFNSVQSSLVFFEVLATVPSGMISTPQRMIGWAEEKLDAKLKAGEKRELVNNLVFEDFTELANVIRKDLKLDLIVGVTPSMIAGEEANGSIYWNFFSTFDKKCVLASSYDLRRYGKETGIPYEAFLGGIICAQTLVALFYPKFGFHDNTGCLFDFNEDRESIKDKAKDLKIEPACEKLIPKAYRAAAMSLVEYLRTYSRKPKR